MKIILTFLEGPDEGMSRSYTVDTITIGQDRDNRFVCSETDDEHISKHHAEIRRQKGKYILRDENSATGTYINETKVPTNQPSTLNPGDIIRLGEDGIRIRFDVQPTEEGQEKQKQEALEKAHGRRAKTIFKDVVFRSEEMGFFRKSWLFVKELVSEILRDNVKRRRLILLLILLVLVLILIVGILLFVETGHPLAD